VRKDMVYDVAGWKKLTPNEVKFRNYLKMYHPEKYELLVWLEATEEN